VRNVLGFLTLVLLLGACVTADDFAATEVSRAERDRVIEAVRQTLRDPSSGQFRNLRTYALDEAKGGGYVLCGQVNATNAMGGYSGFQPLRVGVDPSGQIISSFMGGGSVPNSAIYATAAPCS
jgi:hypothetical protein